MPADDLATLGARASAGMILTQKSEYSVSSTRRVNNYCSDDLKLISWRPSKLGHRTIGPDNVLLHVQCLAIIWAEAGLLSIGTLAINFN